VDAGVAAGRSDCGTGGGGAFDACPLGLGGTFGALPAPCCGVGVEADGALAEPAPVFSFELVAAAAAAASRCFDAGVSTFTKSSGRASPSLRTDKNA
jgi:hypothetical protein